MSDYKACSTFNKLNQLKTLDSGASLSQASLAVERSSVPPRPTPQPVGNVPVPVDSNAHIDSGQYIALAREWSAHIDAYRYDKSGKAVPRSDLVNNAKFADKRLSQLREKKISEKLARIRHRYMLQREAARLSADRRRVRKCQRVRAYNAPNVQLKVRGEDAHFCGLQNCTSVWDCPVCAARISEHRKAEIKKAVNWWYSEGGYVYMVTYTLRHKLGESLLDVYGKLVAAFDEFKSGSPYKKIRSVGRYMHTIRSIEPVWGENGWHVHIHELVFADPVGIDTHSEAVRLARRRWLQCLKNAGASGVGKYAYHIEEDKGKVAEYIAKYGKEPEKDWTIASEMAKSVTKKATEGGRTPMQLLEASAAGDKQAGVLWREYSDAMFRKQQLRWSKGLKDLCGIKEMTDRDIAEHDPADLQDFLTIEPTGWTRVIVAKRPHMHADLKIAAGRRDVLAIVQILYSVGLTADEFSLHRPKNE